MAEEKIFHNVVKTLPAPILALWNQIATKFVHFKGKFSNQKLLCMLTFLLICCVCMTFFFYLGLEEEEEFEFCLVCLEDDLDIQAGIKSHFEANFIKYSRVVVFDSEYLDTILPELPSTISTLEIVHDFDIVDLKSALIGLPSVKKIGFPSQDYSIEDLTEIRDVLLKIKYISPQQISPYIL